jgi:rRNA processing protein Gar1
MGGLPEVTEGGFEPGTPGFGPGQEEQCPIRIKQNTVIIMKHIGKVQNVSPYGRLLIRVDKPPEVGAPVSTRDEGVIGFIKDIFGPEKRPYIAIELKDKSKGYSYLDHDLYIP